MNESLLDYCASQPGMLVVPIEVLSDAGLNPEAAAAYQARGFLTQSECERIDAMVVVYSKRAGQLGQASRQWFPPRVQHLCLVTNGVRTRPYFQPFHASSWLLYRDDIAEGASSLEFAIFLVFQAERQYLQQQVGASLLTNLPYLLILNDAQLEDFLEGCRRSTRPDAGGYRALAEAMPALREMHHESFKRPQHSLPNQQKLASGLIATPEQSKRLNALHEEWMRSIESVVAAHRASTRRPTPRSGRALSDWLESESPHLTLVGEDLQLLWQGAGTGTETLPELLAQLSPDAEASIIEDLKVIDDKSQRFLDSLSSPDELSAPASWMTEGGLSFIHGETLRIGYSLTDDPDRLWQVSPPYERLMLAARTIHEWGHQAAESGWVRVAPDRVDERAEHEDSLIELLNGVVDGLPSAMRVALVAGLGVPADPQETPGQRMLKGMLRRIDDYMANLLARHYLSAEEMDTYVRNNVGSRLLGYAPEHALTHLLRVAYEFQYLGLSSIVNPRAWFMNSTWFESLFVAPGICSVATFDRLAAQIARICDCYEIDAQRIRVPEISG